MMKRLATKGQLDGLYKGMGENISVMFPSLLSAIELHKVLNSTEDEYDKKSLWMALVRIYYFVLFSHLDIVTTLRTEIRADTVWEKRIHLKYVNVILTETIKALCGFSKDKHSLWSSFCNNAGSLLGEDKKKQIEEHLTDYISSYFGNDSKDCRNFAIHYDYDPLKVYDYLCSLSEEMESKRITDFFAISHELLLLMNELSKEQRLPLEMPQCPDYSFWEALNIFPDNDDKILRQSRKSLASYCNTLDRIVRSYRLPDIIERKFNTEGLAGQLQPLKETFHPGIFLLFIYIDVCCIVIAYFTSEYYIEKQLNLRHLNVIVYEGVNKLYGFSDEGEVGKCSQNATHQPFWKGILFPTIMNSDNDFWKKKAQEIDVQLKALAISPSINDKDLRQMSVHIREKKNKDYIPRFTDKLIQMNPLVEMNKALKLLSILPDIMKLNSEVSNIRYAEIKTKQNMATAKMKNQIESIRNMILLSGVDNTTKKSICDSTDKILSLLK